MLLEQLNIGSSGQVMQHVEGTRNLYEILEGKYEGKRLPGDFGVDCIITQWVVQFVLVLSCGPRGELTLDFKYKGKNVTERQGLHYLHCSRSNYIHPFIHIPFHSPSPQPPTHSSNNPSMHWPLATSWKVADSIPDGVIGIFHWHNLSSRTMALGLIQPLKEMSTRNISWG